MKSKGSTGPKNSRRGRQSSSLLGSYLPTRMCDIQSRAAIGAVATDSGGGITSIGAYGPSTSSPYLIKPINLGWLADLGAHFAYWRLKKCTFVYTPRYKTPASTAAVPCSGGVAVFGVNDDPARDTSTGSNMYELRSAKQVDLTAPWTLDYVPTGPQADWLQTSQDGGTGTSIVRQTCAGVLQASTPVPSSFLSINVGYLEIIYHVVFKGAQLFVAPTMAAREEKKVESKDDAQDYVLLSVPHSAVTKMSESARTPDNRSISMSLEATSKPAGAGGLKR
jgi:hypothetical protein